MSAFTCDDLIEPLSAALQTVPVSSAHVRPVAVAVSGGGDSAMLAVCAARLAPTCNLRLHLLHVHHGLMPDANAWSKHVQALGQYLNVPVDVTRVDVPSGGGRGVEAAARDARYQALAAMSRRHGVDHLLLAHHQQDQAETVLFRLLRGTGPTGMAAMRARQQRAGLVLLRPWLGVPLSRIRAAMADFTVTSGWTPVSDQSNQDTHYARAAMREQLQPVLDQRWPDWRARLADHAVVSAQTDTLLEEVGAQDFSHLLPDEQGESFSLAAWRGLSPARQTNVLRHWLSRHGLPMPTQARLADWTRQLRNLHALGHDRNLRLHHGSARISCEKGRVRLVFSPDSQSR